MTGRRIYIHEGSLRGLASQGELIAHRVAATRAAIQSLKVFHHHLEQGIELGLVRGESSRRVEDALGGPWTAVMTDLLLSVGYRPRSPIHRRSFVPVLAETESVVATCADSGYLTLATTRLAAVRMYDDHEPLKALRRAIAVGTGPDDLTMIWGRSLSPIDPALGTGDGAGPGYEARIRRVELDDGQIARIQEHEWARAYEDATSRVEALDDLTDDEERVLGDFLASLAAIVSGSSADCGATECAS